MRKVVVLLTLVSLLACNSGDPSGAPVAIGPASESKAPEATASEKERQTLPNGKISELQQSMKSHLSKAEPFLERASRMRYPGELPKGSRMSPLLCASLEARIARKYDVDPFRATYHGGSSRFLLCGPETRFLESVSMKNRFGLEASQLVQLTRQDPLSTELVSLLLDGDSRVIEILSSRYVNQAAPIEYKIASVDPDGNFYLNRYFDEARDSYESEQRFRSLDGRVEYSRTLRPRRDGRKDEPVFVHSYEVATQRDWDDFEMPLTHAWFSGFYRYDDHWHSHSRTCDHLEVYSVGGKEVCADGSRRTADTWQGFPSPTATHGSCSNDW